MAFGVAILSKAIWLMAIQTIQGPEASARGQTAVRTVEKYEIIWLEQDSAKTVYFVVSGQIKLFKMFIDGMEQIVT